MVELENKFTDKELKILKIVCISDTHNNHSKLVLPEGDILIHAGDFTYTGKELEITNFANWIKTLNYKHKIVIAGNHEKSLDSNNLKIKQFLKDACTYLEHELVVVEGIKIFGTPFQPKFCNMAFNRNKTQREELFSQIPSDIDILITHSPPHDILDTIYNGTQVGDLELRKELKTRLKPKLHVFGHIHENNGVLKIENTTYINAAICNLDYYPTNKIHTFNYEIQN